MRIELVFDHDCPNVGTARELLGSVLAELGLPPTWTELDRGDPRTPPEFLSFGSPTILVEGSDVSGQGATVNADSCRVYLSESGGLQGTPPRGMLEAALTRALSDPDSTDDSGPESCGSHTIA